MEPQQRLPRGPEFLDLVEDERNGVLHTPVRILQRSPAFTKPTGVAAISSPRLAFS